MNEIEKLYENAKVGKQGSCHYICTTIPYHNCKVCKYKEDIHYYYPPFTAEKQLELLKICFDKYERLEKVKDLKERCIIYHHFASNGYTEFVNCETWEETIAGLINNLWQDLTKEERKQIKEILR